MLFFIFTFFISCSGQTPDTDVTRQYSNINIHEFNHVSFDSNITKVRSKRYPTIKRWWVQIPDVRICSTREISNSRLNESLYFWKKLGYKFGNIYWDSDTNSFPCKNMGNKGEITIMLYSNNMDFTIEDKMSVTRTWYNTRNKNIEKSVILLWGKQSIKENVLEHEIGHALGWSHYSYAFGHIMSQKYNRIGDNTFGLSIHEYRKQIENLKNKK